MPVITQTIRYNLKDRARKHRGQQRNFNIPKMVSLINGGAVQERVRMRDMHGYLEHLPRIKFGMNPGACQIEGGKVITIEPAIVTTMLKAYDDGTIEHTAEFLDTPPGQVAARMFNSKVGGFSSAIDEGAPEFYGFDYVSEPNYALNRGYTFALDSVRQTATLDDVNDYNAHVTGMLKLLDSVTTAHQSETQNYKTALDAALAANDRLTLENTEYLSMLAADKGVARGSVSLDSVMLEGVRPVVLSTSEADKLRSEINAFKHSDVAGYAALDSVASKEDPKKGFEFSGLLARFGARL